ncbi:unnamed protein product [Rhizophagus irregularis]|nr:unnamed protein product [Rhizophagus irregularis]
MQDTNISHYDVTITPTVPKRLNWKVFNRFVEQYREEALGGARPVFDGRTNMFVHRQLQFESATFDVELEEEAVPVSRTRPPRNFKIKIRQTRNIVMRDLFQFLQARGSLTSNCQMAIMAMDIIISHKISTIYPTVNRSFYTPRITHPLSGEVCDVIPEQRYMRKLNDEQIANMMNFTRQNPTIRANKIQEGLNILNYRRNEYLQQFGMSISTDMTVVNARILPTPTIEYHPTSREYRIQPKDGVWNLRDKKVATGATLGSWSVLAFENDTRLPDHVIYTFVRELVSTCQDTGMNIPNRNPPILRANIQGTTEESLKLAWLRAGADVSHPAPGDNQSPSFAALCASMDAKASRYAASIRVQARRYEIIADLANMGQFNSVLQIEINAVRAACQALEARQYTDRTGNCFPGTVVDVGITHPFEFDFYLLSHPGLLGTSRPTHYHVLFDENGFNANSLQTLSYNLCYIYVRCTRAVSLVPPVYYAHIVSNRAKFHLNSESGDDVTFGVVKQELQRVMYFA